MPTDTPVPTDGADVAASRVRFLTAEPVLPGLVRGSILASWQRSRELKVAADQVHQLYCGTPNTDTPLTTSAEPVLRTLREQLDDQPVSAILTDASGLVLSRLTGDSELERHLDSVQLAPGFNYAEQFVGTNGIGTALEVGGAAHVFGHEHYAEDLENLACAAVPIHHPISGRTVGAIDLTCWRRDAGSLLLTLAKTTAGQIRQAMLADAGANQMDLFQEYLRTCRRMAGAVLALDSEVVMLNEFARTALTPGDQTAMLAQAGEALTAGYRGPIVIELPTGRRARMHCRPVGHGEHPSGIVVHVKLDDPAGRHIARTVTDLVNPLPGLVGTAPPWLRACHEVERLFRSAEWVAVQGEGGVGKLALLRAVQLRRQPVGRLSVLDAAEAARDTGWHERLRRAIGDADNIIISHVDTLTSTQARSLSAALQDSGDRASKGGPWVAVTLGQPAHESPAIAKLLGLFPSTVEVPPLRLHLEDLQPLVTHFLARLGHGGQLTCSPEAMQMLMRLSWPGNAEQVLQMLRQVVKHRRTGQIQPEDLPPEARAVGRRRLSPLERIERDAIVESLVDAHGNKAKAARSLEMSRATIYRKIHDYGIVSPTT